MNLYNQSESHIFYIYIQYMNSLCLSFVYLFIKFYHFFLFSIFVVVALFCFAHFQLDAANVGNAFVTKVIIILV